MLKTQDVRGMSSSIRIQTLAQWADGAAWRWSLQHSLEAHALIWVTRGQGLCTIEGLRRGFGVHNAFALPAKTLFSLDLGKSGYGLITLIPPGGNILMPDEPQHLRIRDAAAQAELAGLLDVMQREQSNRRAFSDEALTAQAHLLTVWIRRAMIAQDAPDERVSAAAHLMRAFSALVERDYRLGKPMADYAAALGVTPTHLTRTCKQTCGMTAADMVTQRVVHAARDMLEGGTIPIQTIAADLGFNSAGYFTRFIQQHTGNTPSSLRKARAAQPPQMMRT